MLYKTLKFFSVQMY